jgi:PPOX class probable F420-dependent enzyme
MTGGRDSGGLVKQVLMAEMSTEQVHEFLGEGTRTGHLATIRKDGRPHVKPVWFVVAGPPEAFSLLLNTGEGTVAGRNLARDARVSVSVDDPNPPYSFVLIDGTAELITDVDQVRDSATRIGSRYMGAERGEEFGQRNGVPGELLVRITPTKVTAQADLAD